MASVRADSASSWVGGELPLVELFVDEGGVVEWDELESVGFDIVLFGGFFDEFVVLAVGLELVEDLIKRLLHAYCWIYYNQGTSGQETDL